MTRTNNEFLRTIFFLNFYLIMLSVTEIMY